MDLRTRDTLTLENRLRVDSGKLPVESKVVLDDKSSKGKELPAEVLSPEVKAAIRTDIVNLSIKIQQAAELAYPVPEDSEDSGAKDGRSQMGDQTVSGDRCDWSAYFDLILENLQLLSENARVTTVRIDWNLLLNWVPDPGKTLEENLQDLAMNYQQLWRVITTHFGGAQQVELLSRLDMLMMTKLELLFRMDLMKLYDFLIVSGQREAAEAVRPSVQRAGFQLARGKTAPSQPPAFSNPMTGGTTANTVASEANSDAKPIQAGRTSAQARGQLRDTDTTASMKGNAGTAHNGTPGNTTATGWNHTKSGGRPLFYSIQELRQAQRLVESLNPPKYYDVAPDSQEERALAMIEAGLLSMKAEALFQHGNLSPGFTQTMRQAMERFLGQPNDYHEERRGMDWGQQFHSGRNRSNQNLWRRADLPRSDAALVAQRMAETYARTGDAREAVMEGLRYAKVLTDGGEEQSHRSEQLFWKAILYGAGAQETAPRKAPIQVLRDHWNGFIRELLPEQDKKHLYFGAYESGGMQMFGKPGMRSAVTAAAMSVFLALPPLLAWLMGRGGLAGCLLLLDVGIGMVLAHVLGKGK